MKKGIILALGMIFMLSANAQDWVEGMSDPSVNFYQVQADFNKYWKQVERNAQKTNENFRPGKTGPAFGFPQFKRWEWFWEPRVSATDGMRPSAADMIEIYNNAAGGQALGTNAGDWTPIGPFDAPNGGGASGIGRINCITFHPNNNNIVWVGAPAGGLWKSTNGGQTWSTNTDLLPNLGVSAIAIDPIYPDTMFIATGDRDGGDTYSYGILKSIDGGLTWNITGLTFNLGQSARMGGLHIVPSNTQIIIAATRNGMYRSTDGGTTWNGVQSGSFNMLAPDPQNPNTLYAGTGTSIARVWRSRDAGLTWTMLSSGLPTTGANRVEVAVSAEDSNYVYALYSANNNGFYGVYRSTDAGDTWTQRASSPNILGWDGNGSGTGGQGWYDLALAVNPVNKDQIFVGGVNVWRSNNGGTSWTCVGHWYGQGGRPAVHADIHAFQWQPGTNDLYIGSDGGVYETTNSGASYTDYHDGMNITQYYKISQSITNPNLFLGGAQDNGTHRMQGNNWNRVMGGDGMDNGIDPDNNQIMYGSIYYGDFDRSTNGGASFSPMNIPAAGTGNWVTPFIIDPSNSNYIYAGYDRLYRSTNKGSSWQATSNSAINGTNIDEIAIAPSNSLYIYVGINENLYRSTNGGGSWSLASQTLQGAAHISGIAVSSTNPNHIWVTRSGYTTGKVYESTDGGQSWANVSGSLPNLPANCIVYEDGTQDGLYVGTDVGVYYIDDAMSDWAPYMLGLPNVIVTDLEIYEVGGKIRAGTYGRGIWEASIYSAFFGEPEADFVAMPYSTCTISDTVTLQDASQFGAAVWQWSIYPSTFTYVNGTTASSQNPRVVFSAKGEYTVTLTVSNQYGTNTITKPKAIAVGGKTLPFSEDFEDAGFLEQWQISNPDNGITWQSATIAGSQPGNQAATLNFYNYNSATGAKDGLISPALSFAGFNNINLTFDHAYRRYNATRSDSLKVYISTNCGQTWTLVASYGENGTTNWVTAGNSTTAFVPASAGDWCGSAGSAACKSISLNAYAGMDGIRIKFEGVNGYGNNLYLDNINITGTASTKPVADFVGNTTGCSVDVFNFYDVSSVSPVSWSWSFPGGAPATSTSPNPQVIYAAGGNYTVTLYATNAAGTDTIVKTNYVNVTQAITPTAVLTATNNTICESDVVTLNANTTNMGTTPTYAWYKNGAIFATGASSLTLNNIANGDIIFLVMRSSLSCIDNDSVVSNSISFVVTPQPIVSLQTNFNQMCSADAPITLSGGTPTGGIYSGVGVSNGVFDPSVAGVGGHIITYTYTDPQTGCGNFDTKNITVNNAPPQPTVSYSNLILKANPISPSYSYQWIDGQGNPIVGATDTIYIPWVVGDYAVRIGLLNNCTNQSAYYNVSQVGLNEYTLENGIGLYPNPVRSELSIQFVLNATSDVVISILDITGRMLKQEKGRYEIGSVELQFDVNELPAGAYFVEVNDGKQSTQRKFVKQ